ncbi:MAG: DEAD/DEAH box helicase family protein [Candidatus Moraniibacteriota bacterium]
MKNNLTSDEKIEIYKNLFKGRNDIFAVRWEKQDKSASGYTPVCLNEWKQGLCNKLQKKKCKYCAHKAYAQFETQYIEQHLRGNKNYGIYPLLKDNASYFIVADFDDENWKENAIDFISACERHNLSAYLERSRSGNGGHVWIFFEDKYPACKSRSIALGILREAKIIDQFEKEDSFDRLFPNQDMHSGEGIGNLIALPLQGESRNIGNTVFLDWKNDCKPFTDQWKMLSEIQKISSKMLDDVYKRFVVGETDEKNNSKNIIKIVLKEQLFIKKNNLPKLVVNFIRENLNFFNSEVAIKKRMGVSVYGMEKYFKLIEDFENMIAIPRGFLNELVSFLGEQNIKYEIIDKRNKLESMRYESEIKLFNYQKEAVEEMLNSENGILVAPPGSGKTVIGIDIITKLKQPALILVHKKQIFNQWIERIESFTNLPKREIGQFVAGKKQIGNKITVAMVQTLSKLENIKELENKFGVIIVDECHHMPSKMFRNVIAKLNPYYLYGFTATPERKNNDKKLIFIYLGEILHTIEKNTRSEAKNGKSYNSPKIIIKETKLEVPFKVKTDNVQLLYRILTFDSNRNKKIAEDIKQEVEKGSKCLVLTERKEHIEVLNYYLKKEYETIKLSGDLTEKQRKEKIKQIKDGNFQILLATGQLIGEGTDFNNLNCLFLVFPFAFQGKLTQYIGRIQRGDGKEGKVYDYRDTKVDYLDRLFKKRLKYY